MIVCEHVDIRARHEGEGYNVDIFFAETWEGSSGATQWCKEARERWPDPVMHKVYAYEAVTF